MLPGGVLAAAGGVLVQVLRLLPSVPGSALAAPGPALEPLHQHGVPAEEGEAGQWQLWVPSPIGFQISEDFCPRGGFGELKEEIFLLSRGPCLSLCPAPWWTTSISSLTSTC